MAHDDARGVKLRLLQPVDPSRDHVRGELASDALVVVAYQDFLCPYCRRLREVYRRLRDALSIFPRERRLDWAALLKRVFQIDVLVCKECGGKMRVIAFLTDPDVTRTVVLFHLKLVFLPPQTWPARAPPVEMSDGEPGFDLEHADALANHPSVDGWFPDSARPLSGTTVQPPPWN